MKPYVRLQTDALPEGERQICFQTSLLLPFRERLFLRIYVGFHSFHSLNPTLYCLTLRGPYGDVNKT